MNLADTLAVILLLLGAAVTIGCGLRERKVERRLTKDEDHD